MKKLTTELQNEKWLPIPGYGGVYDVSDCGRVRSWKNNKWGLAHTPKILKQSTDCLGYFRVVIAQKTVLTHRLVLTTFYSNPPIGCRCGMHIDNNPSNNNLSNLNIFYRLC
jgi:hypothetical protein